MSYGSDNFREACLGDKKGKKCKRRPSIFEFL